ncbi:MAG: hypothetical protein LBI14_00495 [Treponema sp.]|jgi:hypothetical protein|nr:hypothetical protein [Treponema sp.]
MKNKHSFLFLVGTLIWLFPVYAQSANSQTRSFYDIFPNLRQEYRTAVFAEGVILSPPRNGSLELLPAPGTGIDIADRIRARYPYLTESLVVIPYGSRPLGILEAYNALGKVRDLKGRTYSSFTRNQEVALFEDASRMESATRNNPIPDPPPALAVPSNETVYIRLKDVNFGNSYYRADIAPSGRGLLYSLTNYRNITYLLFTVMRAENFSAYLYMEPVAEGMLIYSVAGADVSNFISNQIDIPSAISKRLAVFIGWISDGLRAY